MKTILLSLLFILPYIASAQDYKPCFINVAGICAGEIYKSEIDSMLQAPELKLGDNCCELRSYSFFYQPVNGSMKIYNVYGNELTPDILNVFKNSNIGDQLVFTQIKSNSDCGCTGITNGSTTFRVIE